MGNSSSESRYYKGDTPQVPETSHTLHRTMGGRGMPKIAPKPLPIYPWQDTVKGPLHHKYQVAGYSDTTWSNDWSLLRRTCGPRHPSEITIADMEAMLLRITSQGARIVAVSRFKSLWRSLRHLGLIPATATPEEGLPKLRKPRSVPRPISKEQVEMLFAQAREPMASWFRLAALNGLRACEVAALEGSWLEATPEGYNLRILGKGKTDLTVPAHPETVRIIQSHNTLGRLWPISAGYVSDAACKELRRLGIYQPYTFHSLRHTHATMILELSAGDLLLTAELLRHQSLNTTRGYAALQQGRKRVVLDQLFAPAETAQV